MVIIKFPNGSDWHKANWAFRRLAEDVVAAHPDDSDLKLEMQRAQAMGLLSLDQMGIALLSKTMDAMRSVAQGTVEGRVPGWKRTHPNDADGQRMYVASMIELLDLISEQTGQDQIILG
jgi:hypothetical protein